MSATRQTLLLFKGHPATGKSTLANALAQHLAWPLIDKDDIKDHIYAMPDGGQLSYEIMWQIVRRQVAIGLSVIVDSPLSYPSTYARGQELCDKFSARLLVVETKTDTETWRGRLEQRLAEEQTHRTSGWAGMQALLTQYDGVWQYSINAHQHLVVDTSQPTPANVTKIIEHFQLTG